MIKNFNIFINEKLLDKMVAKSREDLTSEQQWEFDIIIEAEKIISNFEPEGIKVEISDKTSFSVLIKDKNSEFEGWVDIYFDTHGAIDINSEWNQYIFNNTNSNDILKQKIQDNIDVYDSATDEALYKLKKDKLIYQNDNGEWFST